MIVPLTWRLWRWLRQPPDESPIYARAISQSGPPMPWIMGCAEVIGFILIVPMVLLMGPVYGIAWAVGISGNIAAATSSGQYDLLALTPGGPLAVSWALARATLDRNGTFANASARNTWAGRSMIIAVIYFAAVHAPRATAGQRIDLPLLELAVLFAFIAVDHVQAIVFALLIGIIAPTMATDRSSVRTTAFAGYVGVQLGSYLATILVIIAVWAVLDTSGVAAFATTALALTGGLVFFAGAREWLIRGLWRWLLDRLNADAVLDRIGTDEV